MIDRKIVLKRILLLLVLCYGFFIFGNGIMSLTNPDEVFYTLTAKEMVNHNTWMTPYLFDQPQFEKPIFLYWMMRIGFIFLGINSFSARFSPAIFALFGVVAIYLLALIGFKNEKKAFLSALILMSSGLYIGLARTVFTDMIFSVFILFSLAAFYWGYSRKKQSITGILLFYFFSALAVLTKGPLGFLIPFFVVFVFLLIRKDLKIILSRGSLLGFIIFVFVSVPWYWLMIHKYGATFINEFFYNDHIRRLLEAEHAFNDTWYFYPASMIFCMFPWSMYVVGGAAYLFKQLKKGLEPFHLFIGIWIVSVFLAFQFAHSKLTSYIFPVFPALSLIAADYIYDFAKEQAKKRSIFYLSLATLFIILIIPVGMLVALKTYEVYLSSKILILIPVTSLLVLSGIFLRFILKRDFLKSSYTVMFLIPAMLFFVPLVKEDIEPYLSSHHASEFLMKNYSIEGKIICSKFYARGVRYYTGKDVAVMSMGGGNFFSPHPIEFLDTDPATRAFLKAQPVTYCVVKKSYALEDIPRLAGKDYKHTLLRAIGNEYLIKIEPKE